MQLNENFPFDLNDMQSWIIRRKDGVVVRYDYTSAESVATAPKKILGADYTVHRGSPKHFSAWCDHEPHIVNAPIFEASGIGLWIADAYGARKSAHEFDVAIDGGGVLDVPGEYDLPILYGDPKLRSALGRYITAPTTTVPKDGTRILKIRWADRAMPPVKAEFWPALTKQLLAMREVKGDRVNVVTICQGGHGRSGTALASLIMCLSDYTPLDTLTHIRALHCARAIESKDQHIYLNNVGALLGRDPDALDAEGVKSFKDRFLAFESVTAEPYKDRVRAGSGAKVEVRDEK